MTGARAVARANARRLTPAQLEAVGLATRWAARVGERDPEDGTIVPPSMPTQAARLVAWAMSRRGGRRAL